jgi:hypothetical protein
MPQWLAEIAQDMREAVTRHDHLALLQHFRIRGRPNWLANRSARDPLKIDMSALLPLESRQTPQCTQGSVAL